MGVYGARQIGQRPAVEQAPAWAARLHDGLRVQRVDSERAMALTSALGQVGVEAEFLLLLMNTLPQSSTPEATRATGEAFLAQLEAALHRITGAAATLEVATQSYLGALAQAYPTSGEGTAGGWNVDGDAWWPAFTGYEASGEPVELRLRRCGFSYHLVFESRLPMHLEAICEQLALTLYALSVLPPAGIAPVTTLAAGLDALSSALQGEVVPRHITGVTGDERYPGALASLARLRALDASQGASLDDDLAWAQAQYAAVRVATVAAPGQTGGATALATQAAYEWAQTIGFLESLRRQSRP